MKKSIFKLIFIVFLTICSCKTTQIEKTEPNSEPTKVEFTQFDLGAIDLPKLKRQVNDFESVFTVEQLEKLTLKIREFEKKTANQIAIVSIESIGKYTDFDKFAIDLSNYNGIGLKEKDIGLSIVFSKSLRKIRISTGIGTENILTDEICKQIIDQTIIPEFRNGDYYSGIEKGLTELIAKWK
ncbi:TPM domain-containing protein [Aureibaculum sp. A20]|uniref:TPM domain-containing protein n=1 Tax=Aureibaculum flavum TaxID=2795986 RepID=A0ABS0WU82_9FLAO|nr:TPM domain-containing protein [Aureibaculum flavum]MBJ2175549.1 TPM domain-containing protein [Aureibaculum flavum]